MLSSVLACVCLCGASRVRAQSHAWQLHVTAPADAECVSTSDLARWVEARVGRDVFDEAAASRVDVAITFDAATDGFTARVSTNSGAGVDGLREITAPPGHCSGIDDALVLVVAAFVGVTERIELAAPAPEPPASPEHPPTDVDTPVATREPDTSPAPHITLTRPMALPAEPAAPSPAQWSVLAGAHAQSGQTPGVAIGPALGARIDWRALSIAAELLWLPTTEIALADGGSGRFAVIAAGLHMCGSSHFTSRVTASACLGSFLGLTIASTHGLWRVEESIRPALAVTPALRLRWRLTGPLSLQLAGGVHVPLLAERYFYVGPGGQERTFHTVSIGAWAQLGLGWQLGS